MTDPARARRTLDDLDRMGVSLAIDDFGTGYSSLAYLQQLPVRELKIDRSFIRNLATNPADRVIVESTIYMASRLGLEVTAEGVEDEDTLRLLSALGCHRAQGFLIARPAPADDLELWMRTRVPRAPVATGRRVGAEARGRSGLAPGALPGAVVPETQRSIDPDDLPAILPRDVLR